MKKFVLRTASRSSTLQTRLASAAPRILADIEHANLTVEKTASPATKYTDKSKLLFGHTFTDHMLEVNWDNNYGWHAPKILPYSNLSISPASTGLHYGLQSFEGMKAYRCDDGKTRLFRPDMNMKRMNRSHEFLFFPTFNGDELVECIKEVVMLDNDWIPSGDGYSLYIRPTSLSTTPTLGVGAATHVKLFVLLSPVGPYYPTGFAPISLLADPQHVRAWPGGSGTFKVGGNYAPSINIQAKAAKQGFQQILWLFGENHDVTEVGTMNQFFCWEKKDGSGRELVTAPLSHGTILPGVTRDSVLRLARKLPDIEVNERVYSMKEVAEAVDDGRIVEAFGTGTAAVISPVHNIHYQGKDYKIPLDPSNPDGKIGKLASHFWTTLTDIQYGRIPHEWAVPCN